MDLKPRTVFPLLGLLLLTGCSGTAPSNLGLHNGSFTPCPDSPNCVSSDEKRDSHFVEPIKFSMSANEAFKYSIEYFSSSSNFKITVEKANYLRVEDTSMIMGFVDDIELNVRPDGNIIAIRSASRVGHSDFGVNRERVERFRLEFNK